MPEIDRLTVVIDADLAPLKGKLRELERLTAAHVAKLHSAFDQASAAIDAQMQRRAVPLENPGRSGSLQLASAQRNGRALTFDPAGGGAAFDFLSDPTARQNVESMCACLSQTMSSIARDESKLTRLFDGIAVASLALGIASVPLRLLVGLAGFAVGVNLRGSRRSFGSMGDPLQGLDPRKVEEDVKGLRQGIEEVLKSKQEVQPELASTFTHQLMLEQMFLDRAAIERGFFQGNRPLPGRDDVLRRDNASAPLDFTNLVAGVERWAAAQERIADAIQPTLEAFCRIEEKTRSIRENLKGLPVFRGSGGLSGDGPMGGPAARPLPPIPIRRPEVRALPPIPRRRPEEIFGLYGGAGDDLLAGIERASAVVEEGLGRLRPELEGLGRTGEAVFDVLAGGLRGVAFEGQDLLATLEGIAERVRDLALDEVLFPFLKRELGGIFRAGEAGPGAAGDEVFLPAAEGLGTLAESALGGADALAETKLAAAGVTTASGTLAGALVNELTAGALQTALATGTQSAAAQSLTATLAALTASANAAAVALQGLAVSAGGGGGGGVGGILGSLLGTATGGGFDPGVGPGGLGFLHFGGPRQFGGDVSAGTLFETHGLGRREFFVPNVDGAILPGADIPNVDMARLRIPDVPNTSGGSGGVPVIQQHVTINNTFQGRFTRREAQDLLHIVQKMDEQALNDLRRNVNRGGPDAQLFGRRAKR